MAIVIIKMKINLNTEKIKTTETALILFTPIKIT